MAKQDKDQIFVHCLATRPEWLAQSTVERKVKEVTRWHVRDNGWKAIGYAAIGGCAVGYYACGGAAFGKHVLCSWMQDPAAVEFFKGSIPDE